jgi:hypothetical protein
MDKFPKQPAEVLDYDVTTDDWMAESDYIQTASSVATPVGLTIQSTTVASNGTRAKVWLAGGTSGARYKVTTTMVTHDGRTKEHEFLVIVSEK